jgi:uncharacterized protein YdeI (YjbR/CyaY-like superfamily)
MRLKMNNAVDFYFTKAKKWQEELMALRPIILGSGLTEELKWGVPCYTFENDKKSGNIVLIHAFKDYCAILFFKGALLKDSEGILVQQTQNVQAARQIRFTSVEQIVKMKTVLKTYIAEAINLEKAGLKVTQKETAEFDMPLEFQAKLDEFPALKTAFEALTPGRQRAYLLHFEAAKQSKTRQARVEKCMPQILNGKGLMD